MKPWMGTTDICISYKNAEDQFDQVKILSELNDCSKETIIAILENAKAIDHETAELYRHGRRVKGTVRKKRKHRISDYLTIEEVMKL